jgi:uncharacterized membrane protein YfcA
MESWEFWLAVAIIFVGAGIVKGVVGMGLPTIAMGLLALKMPPLEAATLLLIPSFVTNAWQLATGPSLRNLWRRMWPMLTAIVVVTLASAGLIVGGHAHIAQAALGLSLAIYAMLGLLKIHFKVPPAHEPWIGAFMGAATGVVTGATGINVIPAVPYLQSLDLERDDLIQALGLSFTVSTMAMAAGLLHRGVFTHSAWLLGASLFALVAGFIGMFIGQYLRERMSLETFRRVFQIGLLVLGTYLAVEGFAHM